MTGGRETESDFLRAESAGSSSSKKNYLTEQVLRRGDPPESDKGNVSYRLFFESCPCPVLYYDFSELKIFIDEISESGQTDVWGFLRRHPDEMKMCLSKIRLIDFNEAAMKQFSAGSREEFCKVVDEVMWGCTGEFLVSAAEALAGGSKFFSFKRNVETFSNNYRDAEVKVLLCGEDENSWSHVVVTALDITMRTQTEEELRAICLAVEQSTEGIAVTDEVGNFRFINTAFAEMHGYGRGELLGKNYSIVSGTEEAAVLDEKDKQLSQNRRFEGELQHVRKDGSQFPAMIHAGVVSGKDGGKVGVVKTVRDITAAKESERQLRENQMRYYLLFEECPVALKMEDGSELKAYIDELRKLGIEDIREYFAQHPQEIDHCISMLKVIDVNVAMLEMFKAKSNKEYCDNIGKTFTDQACESFADVIAEFYHGSFCFETENVYCDLCGNTIHALVRISISPGCERDWSKMLVSFVDITGRKRIEHEMVDHRQRLRDLASELSRVEERERRRIATDLHDNICQSLALSIMRLEGLKSSCKGTCEGVSADTIDDICEVMLETVTCARELIFDLTSPTLYRFGLEAGVSELMMSQFKGYDNIKHELHTDEKSKPLAEDISILLFKAVRETLVNIIKYANASNVRVDFCRSGENIVISVKDDGVGFNVEEKNMNKSGGFGLFNIRERLDYVGGRLSIESVHGTGTTVTFEAPLEKEG